MSETGPPRAAEQPPRSDQAPTTLEARLREREAREAATHAAHLQRIEQQRKAESERMAAQAEQSHKALALRLLRSSNAELELIEASYRRRTAALRKHGLTVAIAASLVGLAIYSGVWTLARWAANDLRTDLAALEAQIESLTANAAALKTEAWGVTLRQSREGQRFVLLPLGAEMLNRRIDGRTVAVVPPATPPVE
ncbi:MAG: hypothetical protein OXG74_00815 [Acidobacteria bacterium]|nr:hypothetical protein [Acidobacteriota bacterium]